MKHLFGNVKQSSNYISLKGKGELYTNNDIVSYYYQQKLQPQF